MESSLQAVAVLRQVFGACEVLSPRARLELASRLPTVAGQPPALLPGEVAAAPLPCEADRRAALRPIIEADLRAGALEQLTGWRLRELVPAIAGRSEEVDPGPNRTRLRKLAERNGAATWATLGELTVGEIMRWPGMGSSLVATLVGVAVDAGLGFLDDGASPEPTRAVDWLDRVLAAAGDHRDRAVFVHGVLRLADRPTPAAIAEGLVVGAERVRQLRARARERVAAASTNVPGEVAGTRDELAAHLGAAAPLDAVDDVLVAAGLPPLPDTRSLLLVWLAGPYTAVPGRPGWLATDPAGVLAETRRVLSEDGGVRPADQVHKELDVAGIPAEHIGAWLAQEPAVGVDGLLMLTAGPLADLAERGLFAAGRALTPRQLATTLWPDAADGADLDALERVLRRDARFVRVGAEEFELTEWGSEPYREVPTGVVATGEVAERCWLEVEVDEAVLAGMAAPVPMPLAAALGLRRGTRRTFTTRFGPVALAYDGGRPVRGTLRPVALAAGAGPGDVVALGFHPGDGSAMVRLVPSTSLDQTA